MSDQRLDRLERRIAALERRLGVDDGRAAATTQEPETDTAQTTASATETPVAAMPEVAVGDVATPAVVSAAEVEPHEAGFDVKTSEAVLKWAGTGLVVLAVAFALGLAIERGWITPTVRVVASSVVAVLLFAAGQRIRRDRIVFADTLQGAAFVVAYLTALSSLVMDLVSGNLGFALMVGVTLLALLASVSLDSPPIAVLGVLGGLATPLLLESGIADPLFLAAYTPLLAVAGFAVFGWTGWRSVATATAVASWALLFVLLAEVLAPEVGAAAVAVGAMAWLVPLVRLLLERRGTVRVRPSHVMEESLAPLLERTAERLAYVSPVVTLIMLAAAFDLSRYEWSPLAGSIAVLYAIVAIVLTRLGHADTAFVHTTMAALLGSLGLTAALNGDVLLVSLGLQAVVLSLMSRRLRHRPMAWQGYILLAGGYAYVLFRIAERGFPGTATTAEWIAELVVLVSGLALATLESNEGGREALGLGVHLLAIAWLFSLLSEPWLVVVVVALYLVTRLAASSRIVDFEVSNQIHAAVLVWLVARAAFDHYFELAAYDGVRVGVMVLPVIAMAALAYAIPSRTTVEVGAAYLALLAWIVVAAGTSDALITAGWVMVGLAALAVGVRLVRGNVQLAGWLTLGWATAKLLLHDLEATDPLVRIALFFGIGLAFLGLAYVLPTRLAPQPEPAKEDPADADAEAGQSTEVSGRAD